MKARFPILLLVIILVSCNSAVDRKENVTAKVNNTTIAYNQYGTGDTTLLFVHGWCINKEYWNDQSKYFSDKYKVVTLDLPGFGSSGKNRSEWTFENILMILMNLSKQKN
jgi:pimeloyl-ACP methyl ester carboxylesterase